MHTCCPHSRSASRLFSFFAKRYRRRISKRGFEPSQKQLLQGLALANYRDNSLLEIGCGIGYLHQTLLVQGARRAVGIDLAPKMLTEARALAEERGLSDSTEYIEGDFIDLYDRIDAADVTLLDKVVCCYPDADSLVHKSLDKTKRVYGLIYPRDRWFVRIGIDIGALMFRVIRSSFRPYFHDPGRIEAWITERGFAKDFERHTTIWLTQIYVRREDAV